MAQVNISNFTAIAKDDRRQFAQVVRDAVAWEVHGLAKQDVRPDSVSVLVVPLDAAASLSGADTEIHVLVSGNDWPASEEGRPMGAAEAKVYFDGLAAKIYQELSKKTQRKLYVWVTPFAASGWAE